MAVYAGMIEAMDFHIGRLIDHLKATGQYDNTLFIFTSDNGAEPSDTLDDSQSAIARYAFRSWMEDTGYTTEYDTLGEISSYNMIGPSFASAAVAPLSFYKFFNGEGGMRVPLIIAGPSVTEVSVINNAFTFVTDLVPTILSAANAEPIKRAEGKSLVPILAGQALQVRNETESVGFELGGNMAFFKGDYKIVRNRGPVGDNKWHLFNIKVDPTESLDLGFEQPTRLTDMKAGYAQYAIDNGVLEMPEGYDQRKQIGINIMRERLAENRLVIALSLGMFLLLLFVGFRYWRGRSG